MSPSEPSEMERALGSMPKSREGGIGYALEEALDYLKKFSKNVFVVKFGGDLALDDEILTTILRDILLLKEKAKIKIVIVHGGRSLIDRLMENFGRKPKFREGLRVTDEETIYLVVSALESLNHRIVWRINQLERGAKGIGISGVSGSLFEAEREDEKLGFVGRITRVNEGVVEMFLEGGYIPVVYPVGVGASDGRQYNINSDVAAGEIASALKADKYIVLTRVRGVLRDPEDEESLISVLTAKEALGLLEEDFVGGHMVQKVKACLKALEGGVKRAHIIKAEEHSLLKEVLTQEGIGTMIMRD